jgi:hypothetical protein
VALVHIPEFGISIKRAAAGLAVVVGICAIAGCANTSEPRTASTSSAQQPPAQALQQAPVAPAQQAPSQVQQQARPAATSARWNTSNVNALENGNLMVAANLIRSNGLSATQAQTINVAAAAKAPFRYYGTPYQFSGIVGFIQEYPPNSDTSLTLGTRDATGEVVLFDSAGTTTTPVDVLLLSDTGIVKQGDMVRTWGYIVGQADVPNQLGGLTTQLIVVGNQVQKVR